MPKETVKAYIRKHTLITAGDRVLAGVSAGADSVCLLLLLKSLADELDFSLEAVHVEHGIRGEESIRDARFVQALCEREQIPFHLCRVRVPEEAEEKKEGLEEAARRLRYESFFAVMEEISATKLAVAHQMEDAAETMLFHLIRGSSLRGLSGIRPAREPVIRPLLCLRRDQILVWLDEHSQPFLEDATNADLSYTRNRIRHVVLPELSAINPKAVEHISAACETLQSAADAVQEQTHLLQAEYMEPRGGAYFLSEDLPDGFFGQELILSVLALAAGRRKDLTSAHVRAVKELFDKQTGRSISLPYGLTAERTYEGILIERAAAPIKPEPVFCTIQPEMEKILSNGMRICTKSFPFDGDLKKIPCNSYTKWFDYDTIKDSIVLRTRKPGDWICIRSDGTKKKLSRYLIDEKFPGKIRDRIPVIAAGDEILWVVGGRISEAFKVGTSTKTILEITIERKSDGNA